MLKGKLDSTISRKALSGILSRKWPGGMVNLRRKGGGSWFAVIEDFTCPLRMLMLNVNTSGEFVGLYISMTNASGRRLGSRRRCSHALRRSLKAKVRYEKRISLNIRPSARPIGLSARLAIPTDDSIMRT